MDEKQLRQVSDAYGRRLLEALVTGPLGQALIDLVEGKRRIVVLQRPDRQGFVIETEAVE